MKFNSEYYLPNSEERVEHLRKIVRGRPVAILAAGPSMVELENRVEALRDADICYFGMNSYLVRETPILGKIGKHISVLSLSSQQGWPTHLKDVIGFLEREDDNLFVSIFFMPELFRLMDKRFDLNQFLAKYDDKLLSVYSLDRRTLPSNDLPLHFIHFNTLLLMVQMAIIGKASKIIIFGADGGWKPIDSRQWYYRQDDPHHRGYTTIEDKVGKPEYLSLDARQQFNPIASIAARNVFKTYNLPPVEILNCSENSLYSAFPKVSYDEAFKCLLENMKFNIALDLRVPTVSVIFPFSVKEGSSEELKKRLESAAQQSFSNYEQIIVCDHFSDSLAGLLKDLPKMRLVLEKEPGNIAAFQKGVSAANGKYIFYCPPGNGYLNRDWFDSCVEVLENNQDVSLVWGLNQSMLEDGAPGRIYDSHLFDKSPSQGKWFIYYWLKKKTIFSEGNICLRKKILNECFPFQRISKSAEYSNWLEFYYNFNVSGYQPFFIPAVANYSRIRMENEILGKDAYFARIEQYKNELLQHEATHHYKNEAEGLQGKGFSLFLFMVYDLGRFLRFRFLRYVLFIEWTMKCWRLYGWFGLELVFNSLKSKGLNILSRQYARIRHER